VIQVATGAWYDPMVPGDAAALDKHGNPNTVTRDKATSRLAQCPTAQTVLVEVERWSAPAPVVTAFQPPRTVEA
jgi:biotin/methionine sulfoxide reductase